MKLGETIFYCGVDGFKGASMRVIVLLETGWREPVQVLAGFADEPFALGLLSGGGGPRGRWSYVARAPDAKLILPASDPRDPFAALSALIGPQSPALEDGPPFQGGVIGLCAYELGDQIEALGLQRLGDWPDLACARYPALLAFDHAQKCVIAIGRGEDEVEARARAQDALSWLEGSVETLPPQGPLAAELIAEPPERYEAAVAEIVGRIEQGEIFQANIARRWRGRLAPGLRPFDLLARLIADSPAPFAAYLRLEDRAIVSNSPERFVSVRPDGRALRVETRPIKGTLPRGRDAVEDQALAAALAASAMDRAENLMIVDLMRNDLARVCVPGSVRLTDSCCDAMSQRSGASSMSCAAVHIRPLRNARLRPSLCTTRRTTSSRSAPPSPPSPPSKGTPAASSLPAKREPCATSKSASTSASRAPLRTSSGRPRPPSTKESASTTIDFPAPVSPVSTLKPGRSSRTSRSMSAMLCTVSWRSMGAGHSRDSGAPRQEGVGGRLAGRWRVADGRQTAFGDFSIDAFGTTSLA